MVCRNSDRVDSVALMSKVAASMRERGRKLALTLAEFTQVVTLDMIPHAPPKAHAGTHKQKNEAASTNS
jgi:hypothetical protein